MTSILITREQCGLRAPKSALPTNITPEGDTAHYGGGSVWNGVIGEHARCPSIWRAWQAYHMDHNGWLDIAYTSGVCPHGYRFEGRGPGQRTAANGTNDGNQRSYAIVYIAGDGDPLTDIAKTAFYDEVARLGQPLRWGHREWLQTGCPGSIVWAWREDNFRLGALPPTPPPPAPPVPPSPQGAPPFPLQPGYYFGPKSGPRESVSGYYLHRSNGAVGSDALAAWQAQMVHRGWSKVIVDGLYDANDQAAASAFEKEKGLQQDSGRIGPQVWSAAWTAPIT